jgi:hypothetical protein
MPATTRVNMVITISANFESINDLIGFENSIEAISRKPPSCEI